MNIDPFVLEHFDVYTVSHGHVLLAPKTWEGRDFARGYHDMAVSSPTPMVLVDHGFFLGCIVPTFIDNYRFNTRKHPKRGVTTHASVNI